MDFVIAILVIIFVLPVLPYTLALALYFIKKALIPFLVFQFIRMLFGFWGLELLGVIIGAIAGCIAFRLLSRP